MLRIGFFPRFKNADSVLLAADAEGVQVLIDSIAKAAANPDRAVPVHELAQVSAKHPASLYVAANANAARSVPANTYHLDLSGNARLDRWGRSLLDLIATLQELHAVGVGFVSLTEALDMTTPGGRALAGMLAVFAEFERDILRDRVKAGIAQARKEGRPHGRPPTMQQHASEIATLFAGGFSKRQIATRLSISRASVRRMLVLRRVAAPKRHSKRA